MEKAQVNGTTIAYEVQGAGEPLLLIHGAGISHVEWRPQLEALGKYFRLIMPDVRGHGESAQTAAPYSIEQFAEDMVGLLDVLEIQQALVCGHSMGGGIAQQIAVNEPERVRALVLAETNYGIAGNPAMRLLLTINGAIIRLIGMKRMTAISIRQLAQSEEARSFLAEAFAPQVENPANFWNIYHALTSFDGRQQLSRILCPTLVLIAERNRVFHRFGQTMAEVIPKAQLATVPNAGHGLNWDNTEYFNAAVIEFFQKTLSKSQ